LFAIAQTVAMAAAGTPGATPLRLFATIVAGEMPLTRVSSAWALVGLVVHFGLSIAFGAVYGALNTSTTEARREDYAVQAGTGAAYGLALWLFNFQIVARLAYPWFLETPQLVQAILHVVFFGVPLALVFAGAERRIHRVVTVGP
jgi:hypothetical protein